MAINTGKAPVRFWFTLSGSRAVVVVVLALASSTPSLSKAQQSPKVWPPPLGECLKALDRELARPGSRETVATAPEVPATPAAPSRYPGCGGTPAEVERPRCALTCGGLCRKDLTVRGGQPLEVALTGQLSGQGKVWLLGRAEAPGSSFRVLAEQTLSADEVIPISTAEADRLASVYGSVWQTPVQRPRLGRGERVLLGLLAWHYVDDRWTGELHAVVSRPGGSLRLHRVYRVNGEND